MRKLFLVLVILALVMLPSIALAGGGGPLTAVLGLAEGVRGDVSAIGALAVIIAILLACLFVFRAATVFITALIVGALFFSTDAFIIPFLQGLGGGSAGALL